MSLFISSRTSAERKKHLKGMLRAGGYMVGLGLLFGAFQVRAARAEMANRTMQLGRQMYQLSNASNHEVTKVVLNGQNMFIGNSVSHDTAKAVLDRYEGFCQSNAAQSSESWRELGTTDKDLPVDKEWLKTGIVRGGSLNEGMVVCFTKTPTSKPTIREAAKSFAETGDLGQLGAARYVYAKQTSQGNTHVLTAWTDDVFSLGELVGGDMTKDVTGADFGGEIPRVPDSRRAFSMRLEDSPFGMNVYQNTQTPEKISKFYDEAMQLQGWAAVDAEIAKHEPGNRGIVHVFEKDNVVLTVAAAPVSEDPKDGTFTALGVAGVQEGALSAIGKGVDPTGARAQVPVQPQQAPASFSPAAPVSPTND